MLKILLKAALLFLIVLTIYLFLNPMACSNMLAGRVRTDWDDGTAVEWRHPMAEPEDTLSRPKTSPKQEDELFEQQQEPASKPEQSVASQQPSSQADIDYAIASRYIELEREYVQEGRPVGKDTAREISYIVMDEFEMSPTEWENFLSRATASGLFDKVRQEMPETSSAQ